MNQVVGADEKKIWNKENMRNFKFEKAKSVKKWNWQTVEFKMEQQGTLDSDLETWNVKHEDKCKDRLPSLRVYRFYEI